MRVLDVGCGQRPRGTVNVDIQKQNALNFVRADSQHLPFRNRVFKKAVSHHTIEHVDNPELMITEMKRVVNGTVEIVTPFLFSYDLTRIFRNSKEHKHWFLKKFFRKQGFNSTVKVRWRRPKVLMKNAPFWFPFLEIISHETAF